MKLNQNQFALLFGLAGIIFMVIFVRNFLPRTNALPISFIIGTLAGATSARWQNFILFTVLFVLGNIAGILALIALGQGSLGPSFAPIMVRSGAMITFLNTLPWVAACPLGYWVKLRFGNERA